MRKSRVGRTWIVAAMAALFAMSFGGFAVAEDVTIESYAAAAEPTCKKNTLANEKIFKGVRKLVQRNKLGKASKRFRRAAASLNTAIKQLARLPQPVGEERRLAKWMKHLRAQRKQLTQIGRALAANQKFRAQTLIVALRRTANQANNTVLPYEFTYCRIDPSRFS